MIDGAVKSPKDVHIIVIYSGAMVFDGAIEFRGMCGYGDGPLIVDELV